MLGDWCYVGFHGKLRLSYIASATQREHCFSRTRSPLSNSGWPLPALTYAQRQGKGLSAAYSVTSSGVIVAPVLTPVALSVPAPTIRVYLLAIGRTVSLHAFGFFESKGLLLSHRMCKLRVNRNQPAPHIATPMATMIVLTWPLVIFILRTSC